jgi:hypothetical protein
MSLLIKKPFARRDLLRGTVGGAAISVALPFLDCFLDGNGQALASGAPIPLRFGTWFWSMGHTPNHAVVPDSSKLAFLDECISLTPHIKHLNYFGQFNSPLDGRPNHVHHTGWVTCRTGTAPALPGDIPDPTLDVLVSDAIGGNSRFRTIDVSCTGNPRDTFTARNTHSRSGAEVSPKALYTRIFGEDFADPNAAEFKPDPDLMLQQSVLSGITDQRQKFEQRIGASDKARLDEYFTSIRQLENQLVLQQQKPAAADACRVPRAPEEGPIGYELPMVMSNHDAMAQILAMAVSCNQTRIFNLAMSNALSSVRRPGTAYTHHTLTHEEAVDQVKGYQPEAFWFNCRMMEALSRFIGVFASIKEGNGTLLDNMLIFAHAETSYAKIHAVDNIPVFTVGTAGGRMKTGKHIIGNGDPISRIGLTVMQVMGMPVEKWGTGSLQTSKPITEIIA